MTRRKWTTPDQLKFLEERIPAFNEAEKNNTRQVFYTDVNTKWQERWGDDEPTAADIAQAKGNKELAAKKLHDRRKQRIQQWFPNHKRTSTSVTKPKGILKMTKSKMLQPWQAYGDLTYESKWKAVIDAEHGEIMKEWKLNNPGTKVQPSRFAFMASFLKEKLANESEDVKQQVEEHRKAKKLSSTSQENQEFQENIDRLPKSLAVIAESISSQTGFAVTILIGGPVPEAGGKISTLIYHQGSTNDGQDFENWLGKERFQSDIADSFDDFLQDAFPLEERRKRSLSDLVREESPNDDSDSMKESDGAAQGEGEGETKGGNTEKSENVPDNSKNDVGTDQKAVDTLTVEDAAIASTLKLPKNLSIYEVQKEVNKFKNKRLFEDLGLANTMAELKDSGDGGSKEKPRENNRKKNDSSTPTAPLRVSARLAKSGGSPDNTSPSNETPENDAEGTNAETENQTDKVEKPLVQAQPPLLTTDKDRSAPEEDADIIMKEPDTPASNELAASTLPPSLPPAIPTSSSSVAGSIVPSESPTTSACHVDTDTAQSTQQAVVAQSNSPSPEYPSSAGSRTASSSLAARIATIVQPSSHSNNSEQSTSLVPLDYSGVPSFVPEAMYQYLHNVSTAEQWHGLLSAFIAFEKVEPTAGKLSTSSRPPEVETWIRRKLNQKHIPSIVDADVYGPRFSAWWKALQPQWRTSADGTFPRSRPSDPSLLAIAKGGSSGIYTVVAALSWWIRALGTKNDPKAWVIVDDVTWVIRQATAMIIDGSEKKRELEVDDEAKPRSKRAKR